MNGNNNSNSNDLKNRLLRNKNDYIPIQNVRVPTAKAQLKGSMDYPEASMVYPEAMPVVGVGVSTATGGRVNQNIRTSTANIQASGARKTNLNQLNTQKVKNSSKLFTMDIKLKAIEKQIEAYKYANNPKYYEMTEKKMMLLREYQVIVAEQNLIDREINFQQRSRNLQKREALLKKKKKNAKARKGKPANMVSPGNKKKPKLVARGVDSYQVETDRNVIVNPNSNMRYVNRNERDECECCQNCDSSDAECLVLCCFCLVKVLEAAA